MLLCLMNGRQNSNLHFKLCILTMCDIHLMILLCHRMYCLACVASFSCSILQDKNQIEFLTENKRKLQQQFEEECDQLRKDKIKLTGRPYVLT